MAVDQKQDSDNGLSGDTSVNAPRRGQRSTSFAAIGVGGDGRPPSMMSSSHRLNNAQSFFSNSMAAGPPPARRTSAEALHSKLPAFMRADVDQLAAEPKDPEDVDGDVEPGINRHDTAMTHYNEKHVRRTLERRLAAKNIVVAAVAEFIGTFFFLFFALAINTTCVISNAMLLANGQTGTNLTSLLVSSLGFGFSLAISAWVFFRVSGGVQNPAISLALYLTGALTLPKFVILSFAQYVGAIAAAGLIAGLYPSSVDSRTTKAPDVTVNQAFWLEFFMSVQLIFTVLMLAAEKHKATFLAPIGIGLALFITQLLGQPYTGASVNPARTLGPDVAERTFDGYCWIYYVAPYAAAIVTSGFFMLLKWVRYETATPDQDADEAGAGQTRQLLMDTQGNVVGTMDQVAAEDYNPEVDAARREAEHAEYQEQVQAEAAAALPNASPAQQLAAADAATDGAATGEMENPSIAVVDKGPGKQNEPTNTAVVEAEEKQAEAAEKAA